MCNHRDTLTVGSKSAWRWRIWNCRGPWWGPQRFSLPPQSVQRAHGRIQNRGPCWLRDLAEHVYSYCIWCTIATRQLWYLHTTKTSIPVPVGISTTAGGARVHGASFTPHTVLNVENILRHICFMFLTVTLSDIWNNNYWMKGLKNLHVIFLVPTCFPFEGTSNCVL